MGSENAYRRYDIDSEAVPDVVKVPSRFKVKVKRHKLAALIAKEMVETGFDVPVVLSRPCVYGVFGRKVGGMWPRQELCVGCLRCTVQYPGVVEILKNPARESLGDSYLQPEWIETLLYEARTGRVPVRGAGYRGRFGGEGWDAIWLDMSEIVRPTRDGIHGREFISTSVDIGSKPLFLRLGAGGRPEGELPDVVSLQVPFVYDVPPAGAPAVVTESLVRAAGEIDSLAFVAASAVSATPALAVPHVVPVLAPGDAFGITDAHRVIALEGFREDAYRGLRERFPGAVICVRLPADADLLPAFEAGARVFHLLADHHGRIGRVSMVEAIRNAHASLVEAGVREEVTLIGGGGMVMAEHVPKAIACGLDAVSIDTAAWVVLQASFEGAAEQRDTLRASFPRTEASWGTARIRNQAACWRDQLLEILGAMGLREVRRLRGETGRAMFQDEVEREAFGEIEGYEARP